MVTTLCFVDCCLLLRFAVSEHGFLELGRAQTCSAKLGSAAISTGSPIGREDSQRVQRCGITLATRAGFLVTVAFHLSVGCAFPFRASAARDLAGWSAHG